MKVGDAVNFETGVEYGTGIIKEVYHYRRVVILAVALWNHKNQWIGSGRTFDLPESAITDVESR